MKTKLDVINLLELIEDEEVINYIYVIIYDILMC